MALGDCSETCGGGTSMEIRACLSGDNCVGNPTRFHVCASNPCPGESHNFTGLLRHFGKYCIFCQFCINSAMFLLMTQLLIFYHIVLQSCNCHLSSNAIGFYVVFFRKNTLFWKEIATITTRNL